jgi:Carboxypeptidase regulatory-like domain
MGVLDAGGGFIAGARVRASSYVRLVDDTHEARAFEAVSDAEGRYQLQLPAGRHQLQVEAEGYGSAAEWRELLGDQTRDFALQPAARISGRGLVLLKRSATTVSDTLLMLGRELCSTQAIAPARVGSRRLAVGAAETRRCR